MYHPKTGFNRSSTISRLDMHLNNFTLITSVVCPHTGSAVLKVLGKNASVEFDAELTPSTLRSVTKMAVKNKQKVGYEFLG